MSPQLEFLSTATAERAACSPIEWMHRDAGAQHAERAGWRVVASFGDPSAEADAVEGTVGVADLSCLGKVEVQGEPGAVAAIVARVGAGELEPGIAGLAGDGTWWCPLSASRVLALTAPERTEGVLAAAAEAAASQSAYASVHELTTSLASNAVAGPLARETFARATALDMRPQRFGERAFAPVSVARTAGMVLRPGGDFFLHLFGAGYAAYVWTVFADAAVDLGGRGVGVDALGPELGALGEAIRGA
jgi:glycine cleavage system aminomethyltransferase T